MSAEAIGVGLIIISALLGLAVAWGSTLTRQKAMVKDIEELEEEAEDYLKEKDHILLCKNNTLRFEAHVTNVVKEMGDTLVEKIEAIVNGTV